MEIKVKHEELTNVEKVFDKDAEDFDSDIDKILQALETLKTVWQGQDADIFYKHSHEYFERMKALPITMRAFGKFIKRTNGDFTDGDESFSKELETEVEEEYEQDYYNGLRQVPGSNTNI